MLHVLRRRPACRKVGQPEKSDCASHPHLFLRGKRARGSSIGKATKRFNKKGRKKTVARAEVKRTVALKRERLTKKKKRGVESEGSGEGYQGARRKDTVDRRRGRGTFVHSKKRDLQTRRKTLTLGGGFIEPLISYTRFPTKTESRGVSSVLVLENPIEEEGGEKVFSLSHL